MRLLKQRHLCLLRVSHHGSNTKRRASQRNKYFVARTPTAALEWAHADLRWAILGSNQ